MQQVESPGADDDDDSCDAARLRRHVEAGPPSGYGRRDAAGRFRRWAAAVGLPMHDADPASDLELAARFLRDPAAHAGAMAQRLQLVARILTLLNRRRGAMLDAHELADLVQDVTLLALRKLREFAGRGSLDAWLYALCDFELLNRARRRRRLRQREQQPGDGFDPPAVSMPLGADDAVQAALRRLGGYEADIIRMRCVDELDFAAIAARLQLSIPNVKSRYYRGLQRLQHSLGGAPEGATEP